MNVEIIFKNKTQRIEAVTIIKDGKEFNIKGKAAKQLAVLAKEENIGSKQKVGIKSYIESL